MRTILCLFALALIQMVACDSDDAKVLVTKNVLNNYIVENMDIVIKYSAYNIGQQAAFDVTIKDENFPTDYFDYIEGFPTVQWPKLSQSSNVSHVVIVRPKVPGVFNITSALVSYIANEKTQRVQVALTSELGEAYITRQRDYNRRFASHLVDWILFVIMALPSIVFPFMLWNNSKTKYENILNKAKKEKAN